MSSSRDEPRRQKSPNGRPLGGGVAVKPPGSRQRAELSPARDEGEANVDGEGVWERVFERNNLFQALKRVEGNGGAPGIDGMTVQEMRPWLKEHWPEVRATLDTGSYRPSPVRRVEIPKPDGGVRLLGIPMHVSHCTSMQWSSVSGRDACSSHPVYTGFCHWDARFIQCWRSGLRSWAMVSGVSVIHLGPCGRERMLSSWPDSHQVEMVETLTLSRSDAARVE